MLNYVLNRKRKELIVKRRITCVADINLNTLLILNKRGIILDLDNTLISEDDRYFSPYIQLWIEQAKQKEIKLFILSNSKRRKRVDHWSAYFDISAIGAAKKPLLKNFKQAIFKLGVPKHQIIIVGDAMHTDGLGAWFVGCDWIQVASLPHPMHWWEKLLSSWIHISYPKNRLAELQPINPQLLKYKYHT